MDIQVSGKMTKDEVENVLRAAIGLKTGKVVENLRFTLATVYSGGYRDDYPSEVVDGITFDLVEPK